MSNHVTKKWAGHQASDHVPLMEDMFSFAIRTALTTLMGEAFTDEKLVMSVNNAYSKVCRRLSSLYLFFLFLYLSLYLSLHLWVGTNRYKKYKVLNKKQEVIFW